jgi:SAM-dependent methyltransferase
VSYSHNTYGDYFADVYDEWYRDIDVIDDCIEFLIQLADGGRVLELGVGTGRIAIPLATRGSAFGMSVVGIDSSAAMVERLEAKQLNNDTRVLAVLGHMVREIPEGPFSVVLLAYNTLFNLLSADEQHECLHAASAQLALDGHVVVDCFVPGNELPHYIAPHLQRTIFGGVVMNEASIDVSQQLVDGVCTEVRHDGTRIERPWKIRYSSVTDIDSMASSAGLHCEQRWSNYARNIFTDESSRHISVYGRATSRRVSQRHE